MLNSKKFMPNSCQIVPNYAKLCQIMLNYAKIMPKSFCFTLTLLSLSITYTFKFPMFVVQKYVRGTKSKYELLRPLKIGFIISVYLGAVRI